MQEILIPARDARAFELQKGQRIRIVEVEGKQTGDFVALNLHDFRQSYCSWLTTQMAGSFRKADRLYSKLPWGEVMFTVTADPVGVHWIHAGRCNQLGYKLRFGVDGHPSCQDSLARVLKPYGLGADEVPDVFNLFMHVAIDTEGRRSVKPPLANLGDYIEMRAEMDCLAALSACPDDLQVTNDFKPKPLLVQIAD